MRSMHSKQKSKLGAISCAENRHLYPGLKIGSKLLFFRQMDLLTGTSSFKPRFQQSTFRARHLEICALRTFCFFVAFSCFLGAGRKPEKRKAHGDRQSHPLRRRHFTQEATHARRTGRRPTQRQSRAGRTHRDEGGRPAKYQQLLVVFPVPLNASGRRRQGTKSSPSFVLLLQACRVALWPSM